MLLTRGSVSEHGHPGEFVEFRAVAKEYPVGGVDAAVLDGQQLQVPVAEAVAAVGGGLHLWLRGDEGGLCGRRPSSATAAIALGAAHVQEETVARAAQLSQHLHHFGVRRVRVQKLGDGRTRVDGDAHSRLALRGAGFL